MVITSLLFTNVALTDLLTNLPIHPLTYLPNYLSTYLLQDSRTVRTWDRDLLMLLTRTRWTLHTMKANNVLSSERTDFCFHFTKIRVKLYQLSYCEWTVVTSGLCDLHDRLDNYSRLNITLPLEVSPATYFNRTLEEGHLTQGSLVIHHHRGCS